MTTLLRTPVKMREFPSLETAVTLLFFDVVDRIRCAGIEPPKPHYYHYAYQGARMALTIEAKHLGGAVMVCVSGDAAPLDAVLGLLAMNISNRLKLEVRIEHGTLIIMAPVNAKLPRLAGRPGPLPEVPVHITADDELHKLFTHVLNQHAGQGVPQWQVGDSFAYMDRVHGAVRIEVIIDAISTGMPGDPSRKGVPVALSVMATGVQHADEKIVDLRLLTDAYGMIEMGDSRDHLSRRHYLLPVA
jgi:hypothetical protein